MILILFFLEKDRVRCLISGCGTVNRAVASKTRRPGFESSHRQLLLNNYLLLTVCRKDENKLKETGTGPFFKKIGKVQSCCT